MNQNLNPKISVVMAVYNCEKFVKEAIDSILNQTFKDFEFIVVDDCSNDNTSAIITGYNDKRIVYIKNDKNLGQTKSLNIGLTLSRGKYIARMDGDDIAYPERLQLQYNFLENNPGVGVVGSWTECINLKGRTLKMFKAPTNVLDVKCFMAGSGELSYYCLSHPTVLIRKEVIDSIGFYNESSGYTKGYPQDYDLWNRIILKYDIANVGKVLLKYRIVPRSDSRLNRKLQIEVSKEVTFNKVKNILPDLNESDAKILTNMLEFRRQNSKQEGEQALILFDKYYMAFMGERFCYKRVKQIRLLLILFYVPKLLITNPLLGMKVYSDVFKLYPQVFFCLKFYLKILKTIHDELYLKV